MVALVSQRAANFSSRGRGDASDAPHFECPDRPTGVLEGQSSRCVEKGNHNDRNRRDSAFFVNDDPRELKFAARQENATLELNQPFEDKPDRFENKSDQPNQSTGGELERLRRTLEDYRRNRRSRPRSRRPVVSTGVPALDASLPHGGLPAGAITELLSHQPGSGVMRLAIQCARQAVRAGGVVAVVDTQNNFYPPAAVQLGLSVEQLLIVRTRRPAEAFWAVDQALRCSAVAAVLAYLPHLERARARRLQLSAEIGGGLGLLLQPATDLRPSFAGIRMQIEPVAADGSVADGLTDHAGRPWRPQHRITLLTVREGMPAEPFVICLNDETDSGDLPSRSVGRSAKASPRCIA